MAQYLWVLPQYLQVLSQTCKFWAGEYTLNLLHNITEDTGWPPWALCENSVICLLFQVKDLSGKILLKLPHCTGSSCNTCEILLFYLLYFHAPFSSYYTCWNRSKNRNIWKVFLIMSLKHILYLYFSMCGILLTLGEISWNQLYH